MSQTVKKLSSDDVSILSVRVDREKITAELSDGRTVSIPTNWFSRLASGSIEEINKFEISPGGYGIHWPDLDEDISIKSFIG